MTFEEWWDTLSPQERRVLGRNNAQFVWDSACSKADRIKELEDSLELAIETCVTLHRKTL